MEIVEAEAGQEGTQGAEAGGGGGGAAEQPDRFSEAFSGFQTQVMGRLDKIEERIPEPGAAGAEEETPEEELFVPEFGTEDFNQETGELTAEAQARALQEMIDRGIEARMAPRDQAEAQQRRDAEADQLESKYVELRDPKVQDEVIQATLEWCEAIGRPELAAEPSVLEKVYLARVASRGAQGEVPADAEQEVVLERGGATPQAEGQQDPFDSVLKAAHQSRFRLGR